MSQIQIRYKGTAHLDGDAVSVYDSGHGNLLLVTATSDCEDWVLAGADSGAARERCLRLEEAAREAAVECGDLVAESLGIEGFTSEVIPRDTWRLSNGVNQSEPYRWGAHDFRWVANECSIPIQGRGKTLARSYALRLLPTAMRGGRRVLYREEVRS